MSENITITAEGAKLHATEKVSTGDYETATASVTMDVSIEGCEMEGGVPDVLRARLLAIQRDLQRDVQQAAEQRLAHPDHEQWKIGASYRGEE